MALTQEPEFNKALAVKECRQAIGYAIDYDGIKNSLLGGAAVRPAHFLPIGVNGSTEAIARQIGFRQDLKLAKELLAKGGYPDGFEFEIAYGNAAVAGVTYQLLGAEDPVRPRPRRHQGYARTEGPGQPAHHLHHRQGAGRRADVLESAGGRQRTVGIGRRATRGQARALDAARRRDEADDRSERGSGPQEAGRACGWSGRSARSTRPTTSSCSSRSTRSPCANRWPSSR